MEEIDSKAILESYGLFMDDISQIRVVDSKSADSAQNAKTCTDRFVMDVQDLQRILKDFSEESAKLAEQVKQRKLIAIAARAKLQAVTREAELEKIALLEKIEEQKLQAERLRAEHDALKRIEQSQNIILQQFND
ncbi:Oidioi.mRNA.OKI2018_I69.PAR.g10085.t1.cds [Oikopleura dioica]|uniref:Oidioi.mRNA.OKI2018_I69.PAR.g10085.t1.cds n=1 Tax=Oikopleura dioica TaxID=34765 RepID=A0ABN7RWK5_OIKDI|nr:Oidioi.mRNA.OKI2018_I69.PAR.g10085.t1.cds [Oikopleura dioica]